MVVHIQTDEKAVDDLLELIGQLAEEKKKAGFVWRPERSRLRKKPLEYIRPRTPDA